MGKSVAVGLLAILILNAFPQAATGVLRASSLITRYHLSLGTSRHHHHPIPCHCDYRVLANSIVYHSGMLSLWATWSINTRKQRTGFNDTSMTYAATYDRPRTSTNALRASRRRVLFRAWVQPKQPPGDRFRHPATLQGAFGFA